ncbi:MAG: glycosyltransferase [Chlamydiales bacterium]|nr:glycosyltransferase [Chlamydiales bacterium]
MTQPLVSVVIRTQNRPAFLKRALASVVAQTMSDWEVIIVNDGGPDISIDGLDKRVRIVRHKTCLGRSPAANRGLNEACGDYAAFLDDDDTWEPTFLQETTEHLESGHTAVATHVTKVLEVISGDHIVTKKKYPHKPIKKSVQLFELAISNFLPIHSVVFCRQAALNVGGIDESLPLLEDWDLFLRLAERYEIDMIAKPLANYHLRAKGNASDEQNTVVQHRALCIYCENYIRNKYLRRDIKEGRFGLGTMLNMAEATRDLSLWRCLKNDLLRLKSKVFR